MPAITIVGAGVAGLALAATLDPTRHDVTLIEQRPGYSAVPTAFGLWPFVLRALEAIGLADDARARGIPITSAVITPDVTKPSATLATSGLGGWLITRPGLLIVLDAAVPAAVVREERRIDEGSRLPGDLVVAADGVRSVIRRRVWGDEPRETGVVAIRGVLKTPPAIPHEEMREFWGAGRLFGVGPNPMATGIGTNWYAATRWAGQPTAERALDWARAEGYSAFPPLVRDALAAAEPAHTLAHSIVESAPTATLVRGRYVLIGDAAHAMSPNLGRGAGEAIADAVSLGLALNENGMEGVRRYRSQRRWAGQRTRMVASVARRAALSHRAGRLIGRVAGVGR